jgi:hypothetical protein
MRVPARPAPLAASRLGSCWRRWTIFGFRYALWGELTSTRARCLRAAGAVLNGFVPDAAGVEALGFTTFCRGVYAQDQGPLATRKPRAPRQLPVAADRVTVSNSRLWQRLIWLGIATGARLRNLGGSVSAGAIIPH